MILCDIGNTTYHFLDTDLNINYKKNIKSIDLENISKKIYYICVQPKIKKKLKDLDNWIDLSNFIDMKNYYDTMGIDRIVATQALKDGVIVDVGSAITVDIVKDGVFEGGFIYPGINAMANSYKNISLALDYPFNFDLDLDKYPKNSQDAISYGYLKTLYNEVISYEKQIILTGGDAYQFAKIFTNAKVDEMLIFKGMKKIINKSVL